MSELNYDVVLNQNAGRVTPALINQLQQQLPSDRLHLTESLLHSREVLQECVEKGSETILPVVVTEPLSTSSMDFMNSPMELLQQLVSYVSVQATHFCLLAQLIKARR